MNNADELIVSPIKKLIEDRLVEVLHKIYPEILNVNISKGTYHILKYDTATTKNTINYGAIDDMIAIRMTGIASEDRQVFHDTFCAKSLYKAFVEEKKDSLRLTYQRLTKDGTPLWYETGVYRCSNDENNDVVAIALSLNIDDSKHKELAMEQELYLHSEEIRMTMNKIDKHIMFYDIPTRTLSVSAAYSKSKNVPRVIHDFPNCIPSLNDEVFSEENLYIINSFYNSIIRGDQSGVCQLHFDDVYGERWERMEFASITDKEGNPARAVIFLENVTDEQRLKNSERIFKAIAQHTERAISIFDIRTGYTVSLEPDSNLGFEVGSSINQYQKELTTESSLAIKTMFNNIYSGSKSGALQVSTINQRWYEIKYTTMFDENHLPSSVLFTHKDITRMYERDLAYERQRTQEGAKDKYILYLEADLSADHIDTISGSIMAGYPHHGMVKYTDFVNTVLRNNMFAESDEGVQEFFSRSNLINKYLLDVPAISSEWLVNTDGDEEIWVKFEIILLEDPYSKHIKVFVQAYDITAEKTKVIELKKKTEYDGMTGILNRVTSESKITDAVLNSKGDYGILIVADLDNLKGINDTYGHEQGDRAIKSIASCLKHHFRQNDIIGRLGGDEFIIFLPGAAKNKDSIAISLSNLLRKIASISIGSNNEQRIHCSMGCAVQQKDDTFASLYRNADTSLYHVKRNGKNNYAFFTPAMRQADYQFKREKFFHKNSAKKLSNEEIDHLIMALSSFCPAIMSVNLSQNNYILMENENSTFAQMPNYGSVDDFFKAILPLIHPDDHHIINRDFSIPNLLSVYESGETSLVRNIRSIAHGSAKTLEVSIVFYVNTEGDVCDFTFIRWA